MSKDADNLAPDTGLLPPAETQPMPQKRATGAPRGNRNARKAGLFGRDASRVDMRTRLDKATVKTIGAIEADLGPDALSAQKRVILESIRRKLKIVLKVDEYLDGRPIVDKRKRSLFPVVQQQMSILESMRRDLVDLGLERFKAPAKDLETYLKQRSAEGEASGIALALGLLREGEVAEAIARLEQEVGGSSPLSGTDATKNGGVRITTL